LKEVEDAEQTGTRGLSAVSTVALTDFDHRHLDRLKVKGAEGVRVSEGLDYWKYRRKRKRMKREK
jgi:hypothetical protein